MTTAIRFPMAPNSRTKPRQQDQPVATLKVNVQVVNLYFNVKDKRGALIPNLKKEDFLVSEDGKPQTIKYFAADSNQPLTLGLLIDTSGSQTRVLPMEKEVGAAFLRDVLTPKDLAFLINFDIAVDLIQDYTSDAARLRRAMETDPHQRWRRQRRRRHRRCRTGHNPRLAPQGNAALRRRLPRLQREAAEGSRPQGHGAAHRRRRPGQR